MANPFQQQARTRKLIYTGLILALLTGSLIHRKFVVEPAAENLQLRETSRGEVELTSSAVRLSLTGSRGLAVTMLWYAALKEQDRHKWNEVELLVGSITKLQPYFITPWLFQSWNLAFNVAVENDKPRDKYYYVSRGLQLLAEGERRNQGAVDAKGATVFPGNPDMRDSLGFFYQLKIGTSDEKHAMQCLLDLSCIDPEKRDPKNLLASGAAGQEVDAKAFEIFCYTNPRLVRRLREGLDYNTPAEVVAFLKDSYLVPARFSYETKKLIGESALESDRMQFPIVPPPEGRRGYPNPKSRDFTPESVDAFLIARTWCNYAQLPLPRPYKNPGAEDPPFQPLRERVPRHMAILIFRGRPARCQGYIAETLEEEGWFDEGGWLIREWFDAVKGPDSEVRVGTEPKYHAGRAWHEAYGMYQTYGTDNGLYISEEDRQQLEKQAELFRKRRGVRPGEKADLPPELNVGAMKASYFAHQKLLWNSHYTHMTNFDDHLYEAEAESDPLTVYTRKLIFYARQLASAGESPRALANYEKAVPLWLNVLLQYPKFGSIQTLQEDNYELQLKYLRLMQAERAGTLRPLTMGMVLVSACSPWPWDRLGPAELLMSPKAKTRLLPPWIRNFRGPFDSVLLVRAPHVRELKQTLLLWSQAGPMSALGTGLPVPLLVYPGQDNLLLATAAFRGEPPSGTAWDYLIPPQVVSVVRNRVMNINRAQ